MFKYFTNFLLFTLLSIGPTMSQSLEGIKDIISVQQEKILRIEDNLKKLTGSVEQQSIVGNNDKSLKSIEIEINTLSAKIKLLENNIKNITNLSYNLDFSLKRIEHHLDLRSIQDKKDNAAQSIRSEVKIPYKNEKAENIKKKSLNGTTDGVLGFIKETSDKDIKNEKRIEQDADLDIKPALQLPKGSPEDNYNYALDLATQLDYKKAEKAFKEFLLIHKDTQLVADAQYWLGRVYFAQEKYEEAAIAMAEFNIVFPNHSRYEDATLLIANSTVKFAPINDLCNMLNQLLESVIDPSEKFVKGMSSLKNKEQCTSE